MSARTYIVSDRTDLHFDGAVYLPGAPVELPDDIAETLLADGIVALFKPPKGAQQEGAPEGATRKTAIRAAAEALDKGNADLWTADGKATVEALEAVLKFGISADERDEAHAAIEANAKRKG